MAFRTNIYDDCDRLLFCLSEWSNDVTGGRFWTIILIAVGIVFMLATIKFGFTRAYGYASVSLGFLSMILSIVGLMTWGIASIFLINSALAMALMFISER